jgi:predicted RNA-binding Zn-ribbon protein involved in translation (DUF1610 family)
MNAPCCPFCHVVLVLKLLGAAAAHFCCPACGYVVLVRLVPVPLTTTRSVACLAR